MHRIYQIYKLLLPYLWTSRRCKISTFLTAAFISTDVIATTYFPYIWKDIVATHTSSSSTRWFVLSVTLLFSAWITKKTSPHLREIFFFTVTNEAIKDVRYKTILHSHKISLSELETYNVQEIISSTNRVSQSIRQFMRVSFISILPNSSKIITLSSALLLAHSLCFGIVIATLTSLIFSTFLLKPFTQTKANGWHMTDNLAVAMNHSLQNTKSVRFQLSNKMQSLLNLFNSEAHAWARHNLAGYGLYLVRDFIFYLGAGITFVFITIQYAQGIIPLSQLVLIYGLLTSLYTPLVELSRNMTRFFGGVVDLTKTLTILSLPPEKKTISQIPSRPQNITLKNVSFAYSPIKSILNKVNITISPGDKIGIFGPSGAGKSTLCQILSGITSPNSGSATYGKHHISDISSESLGKILCYLPQDHWCKDLNSTPHPFGIKLHHKISSGGEYQQYLLEKTLAEKPQIIILDETTNALDKGSIDDVLSQVIQQIPTVIMITHRQSTLKRMNRIFQLKHATLVEVATSLGENTES